MKRGSAKYWACLRKEIRWTAVDSTGDEYGYADRPAVVGDYWGSDGDMYELDGLAIDDRQAVPWNESLIERPHEWQVPTKNTPIDAKVWVRSRVTGWVKRHFAAVVHGQFFAWANGHTSWTNTHQSQWDYCVLADPADPDREPPSDYVPGNPDHEPPW